MTSELAYQHNDHAVSAEGFYAIACDPRQHVLVEACAGAGKTWMLVSRIIRALMQGLDPTTGEWVTQPNDILAITFTKRAAGEMRERLQQWLMAFSQADTSALIHELTQRGVDMARLGDLPQQVLQSALQGLYQALLASGRQVQIRTFHSWFANLLGAAPLSVLLKLGLPPHYELLEDDAQAVALVWQRFYAALIQQPLLRSDFEMLVQKHGRFQTEKALKTALSKRLEFTLADAKGCVEPSVTNMGSRFADFKGFASPEAWLLENASSVEVLQTAARALGRATAPSFSQKGVELEKALALADVDAIIAALLTQKGLPRKFGEKIVGIEQVRLAQGLVARMLDARTQHDAWEYQQRMTRLTRVLVGEFSSLKRARGWVDMNDLETAAQLLLADPVLSGWVQQRLDARIRHVLIDEFQDTSPLQWQALYAWLSAYAGSGAGQAPSVFVVGDPKQSIYRFRRADPQVFRAAKAFVRDGLQGNVLSCDHTRRNATQVMAVVNRVMSDAMQGRFEGDVYDGFRPHSTSSESAGEVLCLPPIPRHAADTSRTPEAGAEPNEADHPAAVAEPVPAWRDSLTTPQTEPEEALRTLEAQQAARWIAAQISPQVGHGLPGKDVMVLARKRAALGPLHEALRGLGIASQIGEKTALIDCCEVQDVVALLDVLVSPQHDLSLARTLKSPLFNVSDEALIQIALACRAQRNQVTRPTRQPIPQIPGDNLGTNIGEQHLGSTVCWFDLLSSPQVNHPDLQGIASRLQQYQRWIQQLPPHDALQAIYSHGDVLARFASAVPTSQRQAVLANLQSLLWVALQVGGGRFVTPYQLVRALKAGSEVAAAAVQPNAVRLLTIHGAKGLEAHTVLVLDTDANASKTESMGILLDWPGQADAPRRFVFLASENRPSADVAELLAHEQRERQREEINALYVAMTRARQRLVVSSIEPHRSAPGSWWARLEGLAQPLAATEPAASLQSVGAGSGVLSSRLATQASLDDPLEFELAVLPPAPPRSSIAESVEAVDEAIQGREDASGRSAENNKYISSMGEALHRLLQWGVLSLPMACAAAAEFDLDDTAAGAVLEMATRIKTGQGAWVWVSTELTFEGNEVELNVNGQSLFIDRLVQRCDTGHWWVLDYKMTHRPEQDPALLAQLTGYRHAVQGVYPQATVRAAFLTSKGDLVEVGLVSNEMSELKLST